ncbi:MAG: hypothetical protein H0T46_27555, partial [Deltaproteobacteria bacterium]|nr:hypothetical protein [Deltaproteobacteria bacterium]
RSALPKAVRRLIIIAGILVSAAAHAAPVRHVPPANVTAGSSLELVAEAPPATPKLVAHYRNIGMGTFATMELVRRDDAHWVAVVPATAVIAPGVEYYLVAGTDPVFASPQWPHTIPVHASDTEQRRTRDLTRIDSKRSRVAGSFEWVDYGTRTIGNQKLVDRYYRVDAAFSYRLLAYPLEELRVGYTQLLGDTEVGDTTMCPNPAQPCTAQAGYKVGGWFELGLGPVEGVRLDGRLLVMATQSGFKVGGRIEGRLGVLEGSHVAMGVESMADVGINGYFRLGWGTVPGLPMAATVEITNMPDADRPTGVRLYYDIARTVAPGVRLGLRAGYAARDQRIAGFTTGANAMVDF